MALEFTQVGELYEGVAAHECYNSRCVILASGMQKEEPWFNGPSLFLAFAIFYLLMKLNVVTNIREVVQTYKLQDGRILPKGILVAYPTNGANANDHLWPDPQRFDFLRFYRLQNQAKTPEERVKFNYTYTGYFVYCFSFSFFSAFRFGKKNRREGHDRICFFFEHITD